MVRWRSLTARCLLLIVGGTCLLLAIDPLLYWGLVRTGEAVTGADVKIEAVQTSWRDRTVLLRGFRAADPDHPNRDILKAAQMNLQLDPAALARRQVRITRAQISGLEVTTDDRRPGILEPAGSEGYARRLSEQFFNETGQWFESAGQQLSAQETRLDADQLVDWTADYESLASQAEQIQSRIASLQQTIGQLGKNPLRNAASYEDAHGQLERLARELQEVRRGAQRIHEQIELDAEQLAQRADVEALQRSLSLDTLDKDGFSEYLLGPEIADQISMMTQWLRWGRQFLPSLQAATSGLQERGVDIALPGLRQEPDVLLETVVLQGQAFLADQVVQIEGTVNGMSSHLDRCERPAEVVIQTTGNTQMLLQAQLSGTHPHNHDRVVVNCPDWPLGERILGDVSQLAFKVAHAPAHFWLAVDIDGEFLSGEILIKQETTQLQPIMSQSLQTTPVSALVVAAASNVSRIHSAIELCGTLDKPTWKLRSNLGHDLVQQLDAGLQAHWLADGARQVPSASERATLARRCDELLARVDAAVADIHLETSRVAETGSPLRH